MSRDIYSRPNLLERRAAAPFPAVRPDFPRPPLGGPPSSASRRFPPKGEEWGKICSYPSRFTITLHWWVRCFRASKAAGMAVSDTSSVIMACGSRMPASNTSSVVWKSRTS